MGDAEAAVEEAIEALELELASTSFIIDPVLSDVVEVSYKHPVCGVPTNDPNRYTVHVPYDDTVLTLGKASRWIGDDGLTGRTKKHIHFEVVGSDKTLLILGGPAKSAKLTNFHGDGLPTEKTKGYTMITEGIAWHESEKQHYLLSRADEITVRTAGGEKPVRIQSDTGAVEAIAGTSVTLGGKQSVFIGSSPSVELGECHHGEPWSHEPWDFIASESSEKGTQAVELLTAGAGVYASFKAAAHVPKTEESGWGHDPNHAAEHGRQVAEIAGLVAGLLDNVGKWSKFKNHMHGSVNLYGSKFTNMTAGLAAEIFGGLVAGLSTVGVASVVGGVSATLKGFLYASVWGGLNANVKSKKHVQVEADNGCVDVRGGTSASLMSAEGKVSVSGHSSATFTATDGPLYVYGKSSAYIGAGAGYGMLAKGDSLIIGKIASANKFTGVKKTDDEVIEFTSEALLVRRGESFLRLKPDYGLLKAKKVNLHADGGNVQLMGQRIELN